jgi:hypothetical protein
MGAYILIQIVHPAIDSLKARYIKVILPTGGRKLRAT